MYKALKSAQHDIQEVLLKFIDETQSSPSVQTHAPDTQLNQIIQTLGFLNEKQNAQFQKITDEIKSLNQNIANIVSILMNQSVTTSTRIPSIQPVGDVAELKSIQATHEIVPEPEHEVEDEVEPEVEPEHEVEPEIEPEHEVEPEIEPEHEESEIEIEPEESEIEEAGVEVEEWTFRGRKFFKDSENTVYANDDGEIGDTIGQYDPVKNVVKKIPAN
jgi:hypothetical protein